MTCRLKQVTCMMTCQHCLMTMCMASSEWLAPTANVVQYLACQLLASCDVSIPIEALGAVGAVGAVGAMLVEIQGHLELPRHHDPVVTLIDPVDHIADGHVPSIDGRFGVKLPSLLAPQSRFTLQPHQRADTRHQQAMHHWVLHVAQCGRHRV